MLKVDHRRWNVAARFGFSANRDGEASCRSFRPRRTPSEATVSLSRPRCRLALLPESVMQIADQEEACLASIGGSGFDGGARDWPSSPRSRSKNEPTWWNTRRYSSTSAYSRTSPPDQPGCPLSSRPTICFRILTGGECVDHRLAYTHHYPHGNENSK